MRTLLAGYLDERMLAYPTPDESRLREINAQAAHLQAELWSTVQAPATANPTPVIAPAVSRDHRCVEFAGTHTGGEPQSNTHSAWVFG